MTTSGHEEKDVRICLIGGSGRSGTTLLREVFRKHPLVAAFPMETRFLTDPDGLVDFYDSCRAGWSPYVYDMKVWRLERLLRLVGRREFAGGRGRPSHPIHSNEHKTDLIGPVREWLKSSRLLPRYFNVSIEKSCPDYPRLVEQLVSSLVDFRFSGRWTGFPAFRPSEMYIGPPGDLQGVADCLATFFRSVMRCRAAPSGATHVVEDSPLNHLSLDRIVSLIPDVRLVHIHRDLRDVVASMTGMVWAPSDPMLAAKLCLRIMREWERVKSLVPAAAFTEVALEELSEAPEPTLRRLCDFWDLPWSDELLKVDVSMVKAGRWRTDFDGETQRAVGDLLEAQVRSYGSSS